ncbi:MAG: hypothetical protein V5A37_00125 [Halobacteriales archaeon]
MNREQWLIALVLSVPPGVGVVSAVHLSAPTRLPTAVLAGFVTFGVIFGVVWLAVEHEPPLPDDGDDDWPPIDEGSDSPEE